MDFFAGIPPLLVVGVLLFVLAILVLAGTYINAQNNWQLTSMNQNTARAIVSGRGNRVRFLWNSDETYLDEHFDAQPLRDKDKRLTDGARKNRPNFLVRWIHNEFNVWWVSWKYPVQKVYEFDVPKSRLRRDLVAEKNKADEKSKAINIEDLIETDQKLARVDELRIYIARPILVRKSETQDNFEISILFELIVRVTNPDTVIFRFGGMVEFFSLLEAAVKDAVNSHIRGFEHDKFVKEGLKPGEKGGPPPIIQIIKNLNQFYNPTAIDGGTLRGENIKEVLGVEIYQVSVVDVEPDTRATGPVQKIQEAEKRAKVTQIDAEAQSKALTEIAKGAVAETQMLAEIYKNTAYVRDVQKAKELGKLRGTWVEGGSGVGVVVQASPTTTESPSTTKPSETPPTKGEGSPPST